MSKLIYTDNITVRIDDVNFGRHLDGTKHLVLIHNARANFLKKYNLNEINCFGIGLILLEVNIKYFNQSFFSDKIEIKLFLDEKTKSKFVLQNEMFNRSSSKTAAFAITQMGFFDFQKERLVRPPKEFLDFLESI